MNSNTITHKQLCGLFDHTNLKSFTDISIFKQLWKEAASENYEYLSEKSKTDHIFCGNRQNQNGSKGI